jgi:hypothetical protein
MLVLGYPSAGPDEVQLAVRVQDSAGNPVEGTTVQLVNIDEFTTR